MTYGTIIEGYAQRGNVAMCQKMVQQMSEEGVPPNAVVYNILLRVSIMYPRPSLEVRRLLQPHTRDVRERAYMCAHACKIKQQW